MQHFYASVPTASHGNGAAHLTNYALHNVTQRTKRMRDPRMRAIRHVSQLQSLWAGDVGNYKWGGRQPVRRRRGDVHGDMTSVVLRVNWPGQSQDSLECLPGPMIQLLLMQSYYCKPTVYNVDVCIYVLHTLATVSALSCNYILCMLLVGLQNYAAESVFWYQKNNSFKTAPTLLQLREMPFYSQTSGLSSVRLCCRQAPRSEQSRYRIEASAHGHGRQVNA